MDEISRFFRGLYDQFLLRDVSAKVIPGLLTLFGLSFLLSGGSSSLGVLDGIVGAESSLVFSAVVFGLGLMLGMLLQFIGARTYRLGKRNMKIGPRTFKIRGRSFTFPKIKLSLPEIDWTPIVTHVWGSEEESIKQELNFQHFASLESTKNGEYIRSKRERLATFKEMAGNYAMTFIIVFITFLIGWIIRLIDGQRFEIEALLFIIVLWALALLLSRHNKVRAEEQRLWEKMVIESKGNLPIGAAKPAARTTRKSKS